MINMFCAGAVFWSAVLSATEGDWARTAIGLGLVALNLWVGVRA